MLVKHYRLSGSIVWWRRAVWTSCAVFLICVVTLAPYLGSSTELVRMRNALLLDYPTEQGFDWTPDSLPADFLMERGPVDPAFVDAAQQLGLQTLGSDWDRVTAISQHLLSNPQLIGTPIQSNLRETYNQIIHGGTGYCGDFTRVFMAFAIAAGLPVRAWSFSLDGFGGHGHVLPEIWNRQIRKWQLVDIFNNYYFTLADAKPLSAIDFHSALRDSPDLVRFMPLSATARPGYRLEERARDYFLRGASEWYLAWGNNVFSYDRALLVRWFGGLSRSLSQLGGVFQGVYPPIHILPEPDNRIQVAALQRLKLHLMWAAGVGACALILIACSGGGWYLAHARQQGGGTL